MVLAIIHVLSARSFKKILTTLRKRFLVFSEINLFTLIEMQCKVAGKVYDTGQRFQNGCEEDCICLGKNERKCIPLCPDPYHSCPAHNKVGYDWQPTRYKECKCPIAKCKAEL